MLINNLENNNFLYIPSGERTLDYEIFDFNILKYLKVNLTIAIMEINRFDERMTN